MKITFKQKGDFSRTTLFLQRIKGERYLDKLDEYGKKGVAALSSATPYDTGNTAGSWYYTIEDDGKRVTLSFNNTNINDGVPIAVILQYGHGTRNGGWVEGRDYINPAIQPLFDEIASEVWEEVRRS